MPLCPRWFRRHPDGARHPAASRRGVFPSGGLPPPSPPPGGATSHNTPSLRSPGGKKPTRGVSCRACLSPMRLLGGVIDVMENHELERLYRTHALALMRFATTVVGPDQAHDVFTDAWIRATTSRAWRRVKDPVAVLYRSIVNEGRNANRSDARRRARERRVAVPDIARSVDSEIRIDVGRALGALSRRQRAVLHLTYWEDRRPGEIGHLLGISEGAVKRHLARGRERMRELL